MQLLRNCCKLIFVQLSVVEKNPGIVVTHGTSIRNFTPSCSWDDEADCQKNGVC